MDLLLTLVSFFAVLFPLVLVHEFGHFITAKWAGVKILEFGIGYPPRMFGIRRGETDYTMNWLPLGGFVRMSGEEDPDEPDSLASKSIPWRLLVLSAGIIMNILLAVVLFVLSAGLPHNEVSGDVIIHGVKAGSPAEAVGIKADDTVISVNGRSIRSLQDLTYNVNLHLGSEVSIVVRRDGKDIQYAITPRLAPPPGEGATGVEIGMSNPVWRYRKERNIPVDELARQAGVPVDVVKGWVSGGAPSVGRSEWERNKATELNITVDELRTRELAKLGDILGISQEQLTERYTKLEQASVPPLEAVGTGVQRSFEMLVLFKNDVFSMAAKRVAPQVSGPVGIAEITGQVAQQSSVAGISPLLELAGLLSLNLAIINALPIPMLDGGRILFVLIELVRGGRRISPDKEKFAHLIGAVFLFTLMIVVTFNDIIRIVSGNSLFR